MTADGRQAPRARLRALETAVPPYVLRREDVVPAAVDLFSSARHSLGSERLSAVFANTEIDRRHSCVPLEWYLEPHGFGARNDLYLANAEALLVDVSERCLASAGLQADKIDMVVTVSSSGIATPSLDARLMERLPFRRDLARLPVFGLGCAGGVLGLARAASMAQAMPGSRILLLVVELCGLTFRHADRSKSNVIAAALFGDGAAGAILSTEADGPRLEACGEHTWPGSLDVMGWDVTDDGLSVLFSRDIPHLIHSRYGAALDAFLAGNALTRADIDRYVPHPGGAKVLDAMEAVLELPSGGLTEARDILRRYGNMSAVTVLFVLQQALQIRKPDEQRFLLSSLGPGFTAAFAILEELGDA